MKYRVLIVVASLVVSVGLGFDARADYLAYAVTEKGEAPLPEDLKPILGKKATDLLQLKWAEFGGKKIRVGVQEAENESGMQSYRMTGPGGSYDSSAYSSTVPVQGIDALLASVLSEANRFRVLERSDELDNVLYEQDLGDSGRVAKPSAAKIGKVLGAEYLIQAVVNTYEPNVSGKKIGLGGLARKSRLLGGAKVGTSKSKVGITFKLVDATSGEIIAAKPVEVTLKGKSLGVGMAGWGGAGILGGAFEGYAKTPIGQAVIVAINAGVYEVVKELGNQPLSGAVVKSEPLIFNLGEDQVEVGDELKVLTKGEELIDPETGEVLATDDTVLGLVRITKVQGKVSYGEAVGFDASQINAGDRVTSTKAPRALEFGPAWTKK